jgi:hypothetical protein
MNTDTWAPDTTTTRPLPAAAGDVDAIERVADTVEQAAADGLVAQVADDRPDHALYLGAVAHALVRRGHTVAITVTPRAGGIVEHAVRITGAV